MSPGKLFRLQLPRGRTLTLEAGAAKVMGVVNLTPDSFSDGGRFLDPERAVEHALRLIEEGAAVVDLGAESTRPGGGVYGSGARTVPPEEELARLIPVLRRLRALTDHPISVDTRKAAVARVALDLGADLINDISALGDPEMGPLVAAARVPVILMHSRGELPTMQREVAFRDVVAEVREELLGLRDRALTFGIRQDQIVLDPGIGFGKYTAHNAALLRHLDQLVALDHPILIGASRKSFLGELAGMVPVEARLPASLAAAIAAQRNGASLVRAHDVQATVQALRVDLALTGRLA